MTAADVNRSAKVTDGCVETDTDGAVIVDVDLGSEAVEAALGHVPFKMAKFSISEGKVTDPDHHAVKEMWVVIEGPCIVILAGEEISAKTGDVFVLAPHETHQVRSTGSRATILSTWWS